MWILVPSALAGDLVPLDRYDTKPIQVGLRVSFSGTRLAWSVDDRKEVRTAPIDALDRFTTVSRDDGEDRFLVPEWAGDRLLVRHGARVGEERLELFDPGTAARKVLATGVDVLVFEATPDRVGIGVYREPKARAVEVSPSSEEGVSEEITVYDDPKRRELEVRTVDLATGAVSTTWRGAPFGWVYLDDQLVPRVGASYWVRERTFDGQEHPEATLLRLYRLDPGGRFRRLHHLWQNDGPSRVLGLVDGGMALIERRDGLSALVTVDLETRRDRVVLQSPGPDLGSAWLRPDGGVRGVALSDERWRWWTDRPSLAIEALSAHGDVVSLETHGERTFAWVVGPTEPGGLWSWEPDGATRRLGPSYGAWDAVAWRPTEAITLQARDGLRLTGYVTRPDPEVAGPGPWPLVVAVHGGPEGSRDRYRWNPEHQRYADLGYAVLSVNYRGSDGFGAAFTETAIGQWGLAMQDDLIDGVRWAIERGVADPSRMAITGTSYGGYAALEALATTDAFACGVAGAAPGVLYGPDRPGLLDEDQEPIGDLATRIAASPLTHVDGLRSPVLVWHGEQDQQVSMGAITGFVDAATARGAPITFVVFPQGRHALPRREDRDALQVLVARFLEGCLGGRAEAWDALPAAADLRVEAGADRLPGLTETLVGARGRRGGARQRRDHRPHAARRAPRPSTSAVVIPSPAPGASPRGTTRAGAPRHPG